MRKIFLLIAFVILSFKLTAAPVFAQGYCASASKPASLTPNGNIGPGQQNITWSGVGGAYQYLLRIHDNNYGTGKWDDYSNAACTSGTYGPEVCLATGATSYFYNFQAGHTYSVWIHAVNSCGYSDPISATITSDYIPPAAIAPLSPNNPLAYYVSPTGDDSNNGSINTPFKTLSKAKSVVRAISQNMTKDIAIYLRGGYYQLDSTLTFDSLDSGTNGFNIFYLNYPNEVPLISGGKQITGWIQEGNKWKANVGNLQTRQLYVNGQRAIKARSDPLPSAQKTSTGFTNPNPAMASWQNQQDMELVSRSDWKTLLNFWINQENGI